MSGGEVVQHVTATAGFAYGAVGADVHVHGDGTPLYLLHEEQPRPRGRDADLRQLPSRMLDAQAQVVPFTGRARELAALRRWRDDGPRLGVRLLHGAGGQGKSRLAARLAADSRATGWRVVLAGLGVGAATPSPGSQDLRLDGHRGVLLVVDYADRWPLTTVVWLLRNGLLHRPDRPARVLLLARSDAAWPALRGELRRAKLPADVSAQALPPISDRDQDERSAVFAVARDAFAAVHGVDDPSVIAAPADLRHEDFGLTLALHVAALVAVDAHVTGTRAPDEPGELTRYLLDREEAHWSRLYEERTRGLEHHTPASVMARTTFTAVLAGPLAHPDAVALLDRVERELPADRIITDHGRCYPAPDEGGPAMVLQPLYPDRLAEDFLAHTLTQRHTRPWAATRLREVLREPTSPGEYASVARAMVFLVAAAERWPRLADEQLNPLLRERPWLAVVAGNTTLSMLAAGAHVDVDVLEAVEAGLPPVPFVDLDVGAADIAERTARERLRRADDDADRASAYGTLGRRLVNAGRYAAAVDALERATAAYRVLAEDDPGQFSGHLAACLDVLGIALAGQGRRDGSTVVGGEALALYRRLVESEPDRYRFPMACCLNNLSNWLADQGRDEQALTAGHEAIELLRPLATTDPQRYESHLALTLDTVGNRLLEADRLDEALTVTQEAIALHRRGVRASPGEHLPQYARAVGNLGARLLAAGRRDEAVAPLREALRLLRELDRDNPLMNRAELAIASLNFASAESGRPARDAAAEAVHLYRALAADNPDAHRGGLILALTQSGRLAEREGDDDAALDLYAEALGLHRDRPASVAAIYRPLLALLPGQLAGLLAAAGRTAEAAAVLAEPVDADELAWLTKAPAPDRARVLAQFSLSMIREGSLDQAQRVLAQVADLYRELGGGESTEVLAEVGQLRAELLGRLEEHASAAAAAREVVQLRREQHGGAAPGHRADLLRALELLAAASSLSGRHDEALDATREAVVLSRQLAETDPAYLPQSARALDQFVRIRRRARVEQADALDAAHECVRVWRRVSPTDRADQLAYLDAWSALGELLHESGRHQEAAATTEESLLFCRRLVRSDPRAHGRWVSAVATGLSRRLWDLGRGEEALAAASAAVSVLEPPAGTDPHDRADHATALWNRYVLLRETGRADEAEVALRTVLPAYRRLAGEDPDTHLPALADCLNDLAVTLRRQGRRQEALSPAEETVTLRRRLAATAPEHLPGLATSLHNLGNLRADLGRGRDALGPVEEAIAIRRRLADPEAHRGPLASALDDLGVLLSDLRRHDEALTPATEAADIRRRLAAAEPDAYLPDLAVSAHNLGLLLADLGQGREALAAITEAVTIRRRLAGRDRPAYRPLLARSLSAYAHVCLRTGRNLPGALRAARESAELHRTLAEREPQRFGAALLQAHRLLAEALERCGEPAEATTVQQRIDTPPGGGAEP
ncbi:tetratricopeptide repeat protein [Micromonospora coxensis]|uniref:tetratricopeptide repeat protein n=1 Tax=Micromonospora coxensis TaxID=356852 RepID=UPI0012FDDD41|nr:tetratricopeptide repeat protein [Micromonospora coxensis]